MYDRGACAAFAFCLFLTRRGHILRSDTVRVTFVDNGQYQIAGGNTFSVKKGEDLTVAVMPEDGFNF